MTPPAPASAPVECAYCHLPHMNPCSNTDARDGCVIFKAQQEIAAHIVAAQQQGPMTDTVQTTTTAPAPEAPQTAVQPTTPVPATTTAPAPQTPVTDGLTGAVKDDAGKAPWDLLPSEATEEILKTLAWGAKKYGAFNWCGGFIWSRVFSATLRHLWSWHRGQDNDPDTGLSHLAHAGANVLFLLSFVLWKRGQDDRPAAIGAGK